MSEFYKDPVSSGNKTVHDVDLAKKDFPVIDNRLNENPSPVFNDSKYYKICLTGENASAQRIHQLLSKYLTCQDPKDRAVYRQQLVAPYWDLISGMAGKMNNSETPMAKRMLVRFGVILPSLFRAEQKEFFSKIIFENRWNEPVLYTDEWFKEIASGRMSNSATDEKKVKKIANMTADEANMAV